MRFDRDVFIVGGGPAGLCAAIAARARGFRVTVADAEEPPIDKACGEGLMPDALAAAASIGIQIPAFAGHAFTGIRFVGANHSVAARFPEGAGLGVRRTVLHQFLIDLAASAGVELRWRTSVASLDRIRARWIVGADGGQSTVRRWAGLDRVRPRQRRFGFRRHYRVAPWTDRMEIHWGDGCQFYVTPVSREEICLVLMSRDPRLRIGDALPRFIQLQQRLRSADAATPERGALSSTFRLPSVARGNIALIGDASGAVDAITGEGLCLAFQQASALAGAMYTGDLRLYQTAHQKMSRRPACMAGFMLTLDRWPGLRARALSALSSRPDLFADLLALHVGKLSLSGLAKTGAALGWEVAIA